MAKIMNPAADTGAVKAEVASPELHGRPRGRSRTARGMPDVHSLDPDLRAHLGAQLRAMYYEIVSDPVPERFLQLLEELARRGHPADEQ
jgi:hypothetical protein